MHYFKLQQTLYRTKRGIKKGYLSHIFKKLFKQKKIHLT